MFEPVNIFNLIRQKKKEARRAADAAYLEKHGVERPEKQRAPSTRQEWFQLRKEAYLARSKRQRERQGLEKPPHALHDLLLSMAAQVNTGKGQPKPRSYVVRKEEEYHYLGCRRRIGGQLNNDPAGIPKLRKLFRKNPELIDNSAYDSVPVLKVVVQYVRRIDRSKKSLGNLVRAARERNGVGRPPADLDNGRTISNFLQSADMNAQHNAWYNRKFGQAVAS